MRVCEDSTLNLFISAHFCAVLNLQGCKKEINMLHKYTNECFIDMSKVYSCKPLILNVNFTIECRKKGFRFMEKISIFILYNNFQII